MGALDILAVGGEIVEFMDEHAREFEEGNEALDFGKMGGQDVSNSKGRLSPAVVEFSEVGLVKPCDETGDELVRILHGQKA
jgi:hypothetical protein